MTIETINNSKQRIHGLEKRRRHQEGEEKEVEVDYYNKEANRSKEEADVSDYYLLQLNGKCAL